MEKLHQDPGRESEFPLTDEKQHEIDYLRKEIFKLLEEMALLKLKIITYEQFMGITFAPIDKGFGQL